MSQQRLAILSIYFLGATAILCSHTSTAQAIRYNLIDGGAGSQGGHTLEGFIEFDSPCGTSCTAANVIDFTFSVSGPSTYSYSYQTAADVDFFNPLFLDAGPTTLLVNFNREGRFWLSNSAEFSPYLSWRKSSIQVALYESRGIDSSGGWLTASLLRPVAIGIAVPETHTLNMLVVASLALCSRIRTKTDPRSLPSDTTGATVQRLRLRFGRFINSLSSN